MKQILLPDKPEPVVTEAQLFKEEVRIAGIACTLFERFIAEDGRVSVGIFGYNKSDIYPLSAHLTINLNDSYIRNLSDKKTINQKLDDIERAWVIVAESIYLILSETANKKNNSSHPFNEFIIPKSTIYSENRTDKRCALSLIFEDREDGAKVLKELRDSKSVILTEIAGGEKILKMDGGRYSRA
jgi:hypothetical protein